MMFIVFGVLALLIYASLVFYIGWSGWRWFKPRVTWKWFKLVYTLSLVVVASSFFFSLFLYNVVFDIIGAYWLALFYLLLILLPVAQLLVWLLGLAKLPRHHVEKWAGIGTLLLLVILIGYGSYQAYNPVLRTYEIQINKPNPVAPELSILVASDMHFGVLSGPAHARRMVEEIQKLKPDLVLYPGDLVDDDIKPYLDQGIDKILAEVQAPLGVYASLGNHDRHTGTREELVGALEQGGMIMLEDEVVTIADSLTLVGRKDKSDLERIPLADIMVGIDTSKPLILLDHQPYELDLAQAAGIDLMVSGHTHRGQVAPMITRMIYENDWGYLRKGELHSVVTSGYGFWGPPIRLGSRSELVLIKVRFQGAP